MLQTQDITCLIQELFRLAARNSGRYRCGDHEFAFSDWPGERQPDYTDFICN
jgi:hypothetical protein